MVAVSFLFSEIPHDLIRWRTIFADDHESQQYRDCGFENCLS